MNKHRLIVLRHAKAATPLGVTDLERPLADRGRRDAAAVGDDLRGTGDLPDLVICSPALRTVQTHEMLALDAPVEFDRRVYENEAHVLLDMLAEQPESVGTLLLIGHNPSMHELVETLSGQRRESFPTAAMAIIELPAPWAALTPG
jgi:phosphohistidine phosphatase